MPLAHLFIFLLSGSGVLRGNRSFIPSTLLPTTNLTGCTVERGVVQRGQPLTEAAAQIHPD